MKLFKPKDLAALLGWNVKTVYNKIAKDTMDIPFIKLKGKKGAIFFNEEVVEKYLLRRTIIQQKQ